jgi:hypothetical protein
MSEPLSSLEIEDVLSSIRRLVSEDMRPAPRGPAIPQRQEPSAGEKLILTPALRVVQDDGAAIADVVATLGARVAEGPQDWESETGDAAPEAMEPLSLGAEARWAEVEEASFAEVEAEYSEPEPEVMPEPEQVLAEAAPEVIDDDILPPEAEAEIPGWAQRPATEEEDAPAPDPWQGATIEPDAAWADAAEAEALQELQAAAPLPEAEDPLSDEMRFEEEVLRELVRDIIREELQGTLGERITRNIRKLVRAEVAQALATRDLTM